MSRRQKGPFYLVIVDHDKKVFNIEGPMTNDHPWNEKVLEARDAGRDIQCHAIRPENDADLQVKLAQFKAQNGYEESEFSVVDAPLDTSHIFQGALPEYAKNANRGRVVQVRCDKCRATRWHEMDRDYPGRDVLRKAQVLEMTAKCLICGTETKDPYNWLRPGSERRT